MARLGFCGLGLMGSAMAARLLREGHDLTVWNRTAARAEPLVALGARPAAAPAGAARGAEAVVTMLADGAALEEVVLGPDGVAGELSSGAALIEMSTVGPGEVLSLLPLLPQGAELVDAPVLGSVPQAEEGALKVFVGGTEKAFARWEPVLSSLGSPMHCGPLGSGAAMKLVTNSTLCALMATLAEALALGAALGLDQGRVLDVLAGSPIGVTARRKRPLIESGAYPPNFRLALAVKDARLVTEAAECDLRLARAARSWFEEADAAGLGEMDYSAVVAHVRSLPASLPD